MNTIFNTISITDMHKFKLQSYKINRNHTKINRVDGATKKYVKKYSQNCIDANIKLVKHNTLLIIEEDVIELNRLESMDCN